jgi:hypothetical protein
VIGVAAMQRATVRHRSARVAARSVTHARDSKNYADREGENQGVPRGHRCAGRAIARAGGSAPRERFARAGLHRRRGGARKRPRAGVSAFARGPARFAGRSCGALRSPRRCRPVRRPASAGGDREPGPVLTDAIA